MRVERHGAVRGERHGAVRGERHGAVPRERHGAVRVGAEVPIVRMLSEAD
jgi:hypothetical protein